MQHLLDACECHINNIRALTPQIKLTHESNTKEHLTISHEFISDFIVLNDERLIGMWDHTIFMMDFKTGSEVTTTIPNSPCSLTKVGENFACNNTLYDGATLSIILECPYLNTIYCAISNTHILCASTVGIAIYCLYDQTFEITFKHPLARNPKLLDAHHIVCLCYPRSIIVFHIETQQKHLAMSTKYHIENVESFYDGRKLATVHHTHILVWDYMEGKCIHKIPTSPDHCNMQMKIIGNDHFLVSNYNECILLLDMKGNVELEWTFNRFQMFKYEPGFQHIYALEENGNLKIFSLKGVIHSNEKLCSTLFKCKTFYDVIINVLN
jgi:hypothetical protein